MSDRSRIIEVTDDNFAERVLKTPGIVVVDFWAPWCAPCLLIKPFLPKLELDFRGKITLATYNRDQSRKMFDELGLQGIPNVVAFKDGEIIGAVIGGRPYDNFRERFVAMLADHTQPRNIAPAMEQFFTERLEKLAQERDEALNNPKSAESAVTLYNNEVAALIAFFESRAVEIYDQPVVESPPAP
jgi:thioredoxin 1